MHAIFYKKGKIFENLGKNVQNFKIFLKVQVTACDNILYVEMFELIVTQRTYKLYNIYNNGKQKKYLYSTLPVHKTKKKIDSWIYTALPAL